MKKNRMLLCLAACLLCIACAPQAKPLPACDALRTQIASAQPFSELFVLSDKQMVKYLGIDASLYTDAAMSIDSTRMTAECIVVLTAKDAPALSTLSAALEAYRNDTLTQYRTYRAEEVPKLESAVLQSHGLQTVLIVSVDAENARQALQTAWK